MLEVVGQEPEGEVLGHASRPVLDRPRVRLEAADEEALAPLAEVGEGVVVAEHGQARMDAGQFGRRAVEVLAAVERHVHAGLARDVPAPLAAAEHDLLRGHLAPVLERHADDALAALVDGRELELVDGHALADVDAAHAGALGEGHREVGRRPAPVARQPQAAVEVVRLDDRVAVVRHQRAALVGRQHLRLEAVGPRSRRVALNHLFPKPNGCH